MGAGALYDSPFTDLTSCGPDGLFTAAQLAELAAILRGATGRRWRRDEWETRRL